MIVLAFDPGGRNTGIILRQRDELLGWQLAHREGAGPIPTDGHYLRRVLALGVGLLNDHQLDTADVLVVVEEVAYWPEDHQTGKRPRDQRGLYATAMVYGAVLTRWPDATVVASGRGVAKLHRLAYPEAIRGTDAGKDRLVHCRAAWDHSYAGETVHLTKIREAR